MYSKYLSALFATVVFCAASTFSRADDGSAAWRSLFDGKTLDGWKVQSGFAPYKVENGAIVGTTAAGSPNSFLVYKDEFADFEVEFDVKILNNELNSGFQIRSHLPGGKYGGHLMGPQCEIEASPGQSGWIYGEALSTGWLSPEPDSKDKTVNQQSHFKNGEWNHFRILAKGPHIETWVNGSKIADLILPEKIAAKHAKGLIGLQVHRITTAGPFQVAWKTIKIREL